MTASVTPSIATFKTRDAMGRAAAADVAAALRDHLGRQSNVRMIFAAAPSQAEMLDALARERDIDWRRVTAFHMDEYLGLPADAPERFGAWLTRHLFSRIAFGAVHLIGQEPDPEREAARYAALLGAAPIDIICLGICTTPSRSRSSSSTQCAGSSRLTMSASRRSEMFRHMQSR